MNQNVLLTIAASVGLEAGDVNTSGALRETPLRGFTKSHPNRWVPRTRF
jgi:hypothetical protein